MRPVLRVAKFADFHEWSSHPCHRSLRRRHLRRHRLFHRPRLSSRNSAEGDQRPSRLLSAMGVHRWRSAKPYTEHGCLSHSLGSPVSTWSRSIWRNVLPPKVSSMACRKRSVGGSHQGTGEPAREGRRQPSQSTCRIPRDRRSTQVRT